jgi:hypothetical protein
MVGFHVQTIFLLASLLLNFVPELNSESMWLTIHLCPVQKSRMCGALSQCSLYTVVAWNLGTETNLHYVRPWGFSLTFALINPQ